MKRYLILGLLLFASVVFAQDLYPFDSAEKQQQFSRLTAELRCLVCQNENLDASNAKLANDLRRDVYNMVHAGKTDAEIKQYMVDRYGNFILFNPPFRVSTAVLWIMPFVILILGFLILFVSRRRMQSAGAPHA